jgi:hypothetical protein
MLGGNKESHDFIRASTISDGALAGDCINLGTSGNGPTRTFSNVRFRAAIGG